MKEIEINKTYQGDVLEVLKSWPDDFVDCIVTSPPYFGLRDYGTAKWEGGDENCNHEPDKTSPTSTLEGGKATQGSAKFYKESCPRCGALRIDQQIGLEKTLDEYLKKMFAVTAELKRVLKPTGTFWFNHGDSYASISKGFSGRGRIENYPEKSLLLQNFRLVIRMIDEQKWILRNTIIWHKPNVMPSSVKDRFTVDYEPVFFFTKSKKYWFETQYEDYAPTSDVRYRQALRANRSYNTKEPYRTNTPYSNGAAKIKGDLPKYKRGIGTIQSRGNDADGLVVGGTNPIGRNKRCVWKIPTKPYSGAHFATFPPNLIIPMIKAGCPNSGIVLDIFMGSGTTALVARQLGRNYIGIELSSNYIKLAEKRLSQQTMFNE